MEIKVGLEFVEKYVESKEQVDWMNDYSIEDELENIGYSDDEIKFIMVEYLLKNEERIVLNNNGIIECVKGGKK